MTSLKHEGSARTGTEPCPKCQAAGADNSGDNLVRFDDGHGYCFACKEYYKADGSAPVEVEVRQEDDSDWKPITGKIDELAHRGVSKPVYRLYGYRRAKVRGQYMEVASYVKEGVLVAQHVRIQKQKGKTFSWLGSKKKAGLFGQHLWKQGGKRLIVTEGEIDCMPVYQVLGSKWPVVSIRHWPSSRPRGMVKEPEALPWSLVVTLCFATTSRFASFRYTITLACGVVWYAPSRPR